MKYITVLILLLLGNSHSSSAQTTFKDTITVIKLVKHTVEKKIGHKFDVFNRTYFESNVDYRNLLGKFDTVGYKMLSSTEWIAFKNSIDTTNKLLILKKGTRPIFKWKYRYDSLIFSAPFFSITGDLAMLPVRVHLRQNGYCQVYYLRREGKKWKILHSSIFCQIIS